MSKSAGTSRDPSGTGKASKGGLGGTKECGAREGSGREGGEMSAGSS